MKFQDLIRDVIREKVEVELDYLGDETVIYSTDRSDDPMGLVPLQTSNPKNHLRVNTYADTFLDMAADGGRVIEDIRFKIKRGVPVAPPFLTMTYVESVNAWQIDQHEGRSRTKTIKDMSSSVSLKIPVDLFLNRKENSEGYRSKEVAYQNLSKEAQEALTSRVVPQFNSPIRSEDQSHVSMLTHRFYHNVQ